MNKVLITGARSKIVQPVIDYFIRSGWQVHLLTRQSQIKQRPSVSSYRVELSQGCPLEIAPDIIIHAAGVVPYNHSNPVPENELFGANVYGFISILNFAAKMKTKKIVFISSTDVYGHVKNGNVISEKTACMPDNFYGLTKLACEKISVTYGHVQGMDTTILRLGPVFGPGMNENLAMFRLLSNALRGNEIHLVNPDSILSLVSVPDAADAIIKSCFSPPDVVNIAGRPLTLRVFFERAYEARGFQPKIIFGHDKDSQTRLIFDLRKAKRVLGWSPDMALESIFAHMASNLPGY